jgi:hypothetical protein
MASSIPRLCDVGRLHWLEAARPLCRRGETAQSIWIENKEGAKARGIWCQICVD